MGPLLAAMAGPSDSIVTTRANGVRASKRVQPGQSDRLAIELTVEIERDTAVRVRVEERIPDGTTVDLQPPPDAATWVFDGTNLVLDGRVAPDRPVTASYRLTGRPELGNDEPEAPAIAVEEAPAGETRNDGSTGDDPDADSEAERRPDGVRAPGATSPIPPALAGSGETPTADDAKTGVPTGGGGPDRTIDTIRTRLRTLEDAIATLETEIDQDASTAALRSRLASLRTELTGISALVDRLGPDRDD